MTTFGNARYFYYEKTGDKENEKPGRLTIAQASLKPPTPNIAKVFTDAQEVAR